MLTAFRVDHAKPQQMVLNKYVLPIPFTMLANGGGNEHPVLWLEVLERAMAVEFMRETREFAFLHDEIRCGGHEGGDPCNAILTHKAQLFDMVCSKIRFLLTPTVRLQNMVYSQGLKFSKETSFFNWLVPRAAVQGPPRGEQVALGEVAIADLTCACCNRHLGFTCVDDRIGCYRYLVGRSALDKDNWMRVSVNLDDPDLFMWGMMRLSRCRREEEFTEEGTINSEDVIPNVAAFCKHIQNSRQVI